MAIYRTYIPQPPLADFVDSFWLYEGYDPPHTKERRLPDGSIELVISLIEKAQRIEWTNIALTCGYFDQAHLIHDFQAFSGLTPGAYLTLRGEQRNHIPLHKD